MKRILLIGATSQVASDIARLYVARDARLYLLGRSENKYAALLRELGKNVIGGECYDFCESQKNGPAIQKAFAEAGGFELVIIAHGYLGDQQLSESDFSEAKKQIMINYVSVVEQLVCITQQLESLSERSLGQRPQIAVITSVAGERGRPRNYTYGSAKGALSLYLEGLRSRLFGKVCITTIKLGPVETPMTADHKKTFVFSTSSAAAKKIIRAIEKRRSIAFVPGYFRLIMAVVTRLPEPIFQKMSVFSGR